MQLRQRQEMVELSADARGIYDAFFDGKPGYLIGVRGRSVGTVLNHAGRVLPRLWADQQRQEADDASRVNDRRAADRRGFYSYGVPTILATVSMATSAVILLCHPEPGSLWHQTSVGAGFLGTASLGWMMLRAPFDVVRMALRNRCETALRNDRELSVYRLAQSFSLPRLTDQMIEDFVSQDPFERTLVSLYTGQLVGKDYLITYGRNSNREPFIVIGVRDVIVRPPVPDFDPPVSPF